MKHPNLLSSLLSVLPERPRTEIQHVHDVTATCVGKQPAVADYPVIVGTTLGIIGLASSTPAAKELCGSRFDG